MNYLRPDLKRGNFAEDEEDLIIKLHALLGNRYEFIMIMCHESNFIRCAFDNTQKVQQFILFYFFTYLNAITYSIRCIVWKSWVNEILNYIDQLWL